MRHAHDSQLNPPKQDRSRKTVARLLDAAEALFARKSFDDTTVVEIAAAAGYTIGAFYRRFPDKEALLAALFADLETEAATRAADVLDPVKWRGADLDAIVSAVVAELAAMYRLRRGVIRAVALHACVNEELRAKDRDLLATLSERLRVLVAPYLDALDHPAPVQALLFGLEFVVATLRNRIVFGSGLAGDEARLVAELSRAYLAYLGVRKTAQSPPPGPSLE